MDIDPGTRPELWEGAVAWTTEDRWHAPWRLRPEDEAIAYAPALYVRARLATGVRLNARTDARALRVDLDTAADFHGALDVLIDGQLSARVPVAAGESRLDIALAGIPADVELWLPHTGRLRVGAVTAENATAAEPVDAGRVRWAAYGSSITQCSESSGPSETWPALVARDWNLDLTCLGFGAESHLDPIVPDTIAGLRPDLITLCLGINVYGQASFGRRTWPGQVAGFIRANRRGNPDADIVVISPVTNPERDDTPNAAGMTLQDLRDDVERVTADLARDDARLSGICGLDLLGTEDAHLLLDGVHPSPEGYRLMGSRISPKLGAVVQERAARTAAEEGLSR